MIICIACIIVFKIKSLYSGFMAIVIALIIACVHPHFYIDDSIVSSIIGTSSILTLTVAMIIVPGLIFNSLQKEQRIIDQLVICINHLISIIFFRNYSCI